MAQCFSIAIQTSAKLLGFSPPHRNLGRGISSIIRCTLSVSAVCIGDSPIVNFLS